MILHGSGSMHLPAHGSISLSAGCRRNCSHDIGRTRKSLERGESARVVRVLHWSNQLILRHHSEHRQRCTYIMDGGETIDMGFRLCWLSSKTVEKGRFDVSNCV